MPRPAHYPLHGEPQRSIQLDPPQEPEEPAQVEHKQSRQNAKQDPDAAQRNRRLPLFKRLLALPHYLALYVLGILQTFVVLIARFAILFTGRYPQPLFTFMLNTERRIPRVEAYAFLLITDRYPSFRLG